MRTLIKKTLIVILFALIIAFGGFIALILWHYIDSLVPTPRH